LGGRNVTNDITIGLRTSLEQAESLKNMYGSALTSLVDADEMMEVPTAVGREPRQISRNVLASIIEPRMEEILSLTQREIKKAGMIDPLAAGVVLTGGGAKLPGIVDLAEQILDMPVKIGIPRGIEGLPDNLATSENAAVIGLVLYGLQHGTGGAVAKGGIKGLIKKIENWISSNF
jgi:cell division protein FtsA